eukprot:scaffold13578_cov173-Alexandrium_tamarense.AAC.9
MPTRRILLCGRAGRKWHWARSVAQASCKSWEISVAFSKLIVAASLSLTSYLKLMVRNPKRISLIMIDEDCRYGEDSASLILSLNQRNKEVTSHCCSKRMRITIYLLCTLTLGRLFLKGMSAERLSELRKA